MIPIEFEDYLRSLILLWAVIDPLGTVPVYLHATRGMSASTRRRVAMRATLVAGAVLTAFTVGGQLLLEAMGIPLPAFQIAGGVVVFLFALTMIFGESKPEAEIALADARDSEGDLDAAIYPLAMPSLASPAAMIAVVMLTDNSYYDSLTSLLAADLLVIALVAGVLIAAWVAMRLADPILGAIGEAGASIVSRIMGLILASVATTNVLTGIKVFFDL